VISEQRPIAATVCRDLEDRILSETLSAGEQVPSWGALSTEYGISSSTAAAATNRLTRRGLLERRRGIGLFVSPAAREEIVRERSASFDEKYVAPLLEEARRLGYSVDDLLALLDGRAWEAGSPPETAGEPSGHRYGR
tara:strand:+ start:745 stop:1158 length:414 start_codon:yes stop_codon:yes gene_type:complete